MPTGNKLTANNAYLSDPETSTQYQSVNNVEILQYLRCFVTGLLRKDPYLAVILDRSVL